MKSTLYNNAHYRIIKNMKKINLHTSIKYLVVSIATALTCTSISQADTGGDGSTRNVKQIGDLEIYKAATGGKINIMLMLDTSGSMDEPYMRANAGGMREAATACNLTRGKAYTPLDGTENSMPSNIASPYNYVKHGCIYSKEQQAFEKRYFYKTVATKIITDTTTVYEGYSSTSTPSNKIKLTYTEQSSTDSNSTNAPTAWYRCDNQYIGSETGSTDKNDCTITTSKRTFSEYTAEPSEVTDNTTTSGPTKNKLTTATTFTDKDGKSWTIRANTSTYPATKTVTTTTRTITTTVYYVKDVEKTDYVDTKVYDRLTQLKDAIFTLLNDPKLDKDKVKIGIGQFSSQSGSDNIYTSADNRSGKILVPVADLGDEQINKIKAAVAKLKGAGGTPTANAYAEAGAYMLGTNTSALDYPEREDYVQVLASNGYYYTFACNWWDTDNISCRNYDRNTTYSANNLINNGYKASTCSTKNASYLTYGKTCFLKRTEDVGMRVSAYSGFGKSVMSSKDSSNTDNYQTPLDEKSATCSGQGIYFLTDGAPNSAPYPLPLMKQALDTKGTAFETAYTNATTKIPIGSDSYGGMPEVGEFAKALRSATLNPLGAKLPIVTATVGFGSEFNVDKEADAKETDLTKKILRSLTYTDSKGKEKTRTYYNCANLSTQDAKNLCNWGEKAHTSLTGVGGYGEGGFYSAQSTTDVVDSILAFAQDLDQTLPSTPAGTIVVPDDPYRADSQMAIAFYPTLQADVAGSPAVWSGNMKKFKLNEGTLYGKKTGTTENKLFKDTAGNLNPATADLWSALDVTDKNNEVTVGGLYSNLKTPTTALSDTRSIYIEDNGTMKKFGVNSAGKVTLGDNVLSADNKFVDTATYTDTVVQTLLEYLGFELTTDQKAQPIADLVLTASGKDTKVLGASIHSVPNMISYSATLDSAGKVSSTRDDYALFGSSDGALHLVNADNFGTGDGGKEIFAFIPKTMLTNQLDALKPAGKRGVGKPYFGVDAPWLVDAKYKFDVTDKKVTTEYVKAYGGFRLGGEGLYGLNLTNKASPSLLFSINSSSTGFERIGQIWAKPTKAKIKTASGATDVLVFGGGYDTCYEDENFQVSTTTSSLTNQRGETCNTKTEAVGNAIYIVNATTGALIWSASGSATPAPSTSVSTMTSSIVGGVTVLDRNNDGFMDQIYFADLGGQLFRADFTNAGFKKPVSTGSPTPETDFSNMRVVRVLKPAFTGTEIKYNHRFYERPVVSFYRGDSTFNNGRLFALVNVISGDRSSPLSKMRTTDDQADRVYGILDTDVTLSDNILYSTDFDGESTTVTTIKVKELDDSKLQALGSAFSATNTKDKTVTNLKGKNGWYYKLNRFDGYSNVKYTKGIGKSEVVDGFLYTTTYNPDMQYGTTNICSAQIVGGSERELYCLPFGVCGDDKSTNGTGGFMRAGQGIQELTLGPYSDTKGNIRLLIGTQSITERANGSDPANPTRINFGTGWGSKKLLNQTGIETTLSDGSAPELIFNERYTMKPKTWYEATK